MDISQSLEHEVKRTGAESRPLKLNQLLTELLSGNRRHIKVGHTLGRHRLSSLSVRSPICPAEAVMAIRRLLLVGAIGGHIRGLGVVR